MAQPELGSLIAIIDKIIADAGLDQVAAQAVKREAEGAAIPALSLAELIDLQNEINLATYSCVAALMADNRVEAYNSFTKLGEHMIRANRQSGMVTVRVVAAISDLAKKAAEQGAG